MATTTTTTTTTTTPTTASVHFKRAAGFLKNREEALRARQFGGPPVPVDANRTFFCFYNKNCGAHWGGQNRYQAILHVMEHMFDALHSSVERHGIKLEDSIPFMSDEEMDDDQARPPALGEKRKREELNHVSAERANFLRDLLAEAIVATGTPFSLADSPHFRRFVREVTGNPDRTITPHGQIISSTIVPALFEKVKEHQAWSLRDKKRKVHMDTNMWASPSGTHFMAIILFWLDDELKPQVQTLRVLEFPNVASTSDSIFEVLRIVIEENGLDVICISRTHAANMTAATNKTFELMKIPGVGCGAHHLHLLATDHFFPSEKKKATTFHVESEEMMAVPDNLEELQAELRGQPQEHRSARAGLPSAKVRAATESTVQLSPEEKLQAAWAQFASEIEATYREEFREILITAMNLIKAFTSSGGQRMTKLEAAIKTHEENHPGISCPKPYMPGELRFLDIMVAFGALLQCKTPILTVIQQETLANHLNARVPVTKDFHVPATVEDFFASWRESKSPPVSTLTLPDIGFWAKLEILVATFDPICALVKGLQNDSIILHLTFMYLRDLRFVITSEPKECNFQVALHGHVAQLLKCRENTRSEFEEIALSVAPFFIPSIAVVCNLKTYCADLGNSFLASSDDPAVVLELFRKLGVPFEETVATVPRLKRSTEFRRCIVDDVSNQPPLLAEIKSWIKDCSDASIFPEDYSISIFKDPEQLLEFWRKQTQRPLLREAFRMIFTIRPASIVSERLFSGAGFIVDDKRTCLSDPMVEKLTVMKTEFCQQGSHFSFTPAMGKTMLPGQRVKLSLDGEEIV